MRARQHRGKLSRQMGRSRQMRVLLAGMSNMLAEIVGSVLAQSLGADVAGRINLNEDLAAAIRRTHVDVLVLSAPQPGETWSIMPLLHQFPLLKLIAITPNGHSGCLHELCLCSTPLAELSAESLAAALTDTSTWRPH
jgi:hypothetical protein